MKKKLVTVLLASSMVATGLPDTDSLKKHTRTARQSLSVFPILRASILRNWKPSGRLCRSLFRWRHIPISHSRSFERRWINTAYA